LPRTYIAGHQGRPRTGAVCNCKGCGKAIYLKLSDILRGYRYCGECRNRLSFPPARIEKGGRRVAGFAGSFCSKCKSTLLMRCEDGLECLQCGKVIYLAFPKVSRKP